MWTSRRQGLRGEEKEDEGASYQGWALILPQKSCGGEGGELLGRGCEWASGRTTWGQSWRIQQLTRASIVNEQTPPHRPGHLWTPPRHAQDTSGHRGGLLGRQVWADAGKKPLSWAVPGDTA